MSKLDHETIEAQDELLAKLQMALKPFADFADPNDRVPRDFVITKGSSFAKRQITMGDCYDARAVLIESKS